MHQKPKYDDRSFGFLRCNRCGKRINRSEAEVSQFAKSDTWPMCCDEVMRFYGGDEATEELPRYSDPSNRS